ncbi:DUF2935 domain-containing protein [Paenibacillus sp. 1011MAR3C5]|uniref:DUF2935 domain-containing protein n=1 Tax=Paenibacillus sp. 1011MAR3C5 TaxID=1675787 RepID=UPI000E6C9EB1|nr:DUF2935 domain-containing protein [Paenibacillus sp. 1011MAR3C5]RJE87647.1 DUF2935 domain-containing protein [Paenibacillus sp. 1011MAR3C5]
MDEQAWFEHRFWLQILGDHARFIYNALSPVELKDIQTASRFIHHFDQLLTQAREQSVPLAELNSAASALTGQLRSFKLDLLDRSLQGKVKIGLTPTFLNHMVNELEEYARILASLLEGKGVPQFPSLHHDLLWLQDASGHAASLAMDLDAVEKRLIKKSQKFEKHFTQYYMKAIELTGYFRTMRDRYPVLGKFHNDVNLEMKVFMSFLKELEELELGEELLSRIDPLMPNHMYREECYYLLKLSQGGDIALPNCDPAEPRI